MADPAIDKEVQIATTEAQKISETAGKITIRSNKDLDAANEQLIIVKRTGKDIEKRRKAITQPMNQAVKEVNALFAEPADKLKAAESALKEGILKYHDKLEKQAEKRAERVEAQVDAGELGVADGIGKISSIKQAPSSMQSSEGTSSVKTVRKIRIINPAELPASYFMRPRVIEALRMEVEEDVKRKGMEVPAGAEAYEDKQLAVRA